MASVGGDLPRLNPNRNRNNKQSLGEKFNRCVRSPKAWFCTIVVVFTAMVVVLNFSVPGIVDSEVVNHVFTERKFGGLYAGKTPKPKEDPLQLEEAVLKRIREEVLKQLEKEVESITDEVLKQLKKEALENIRVEDSKQSEKEVSEKIRVEDSKQSEKEVLEKIGGFDFGGDIKSVLTKLLTKFPKEDQDFNVPSSWPKGRRYGSRKPTIALVFENLLVGPQHILMVTIAAALKKIGYAVEVYSLAYGPVYAVWTKAGFPVRILKDGNMGTFVNWLNYDCILVNSLEASEIFPRLMEVPFTAVPIIWTIHERELANRLSQYTSTGRVELVNKWKKIFRRATVVVFPNYALPMLYASCHAGNYFVIPGSPVEAWEVVNYKLPNNRSLRRKMDYDLDDLIIAIVGSQFSYSGLWLDHTFILQALLPLLEEFSTVHPSLPNLKIVILTGDLTGNYSMAVEAIAMNLRYPMDTVKHVSAVELDADAVLHMSDLVIYGSSLDELSFPDILVKAMCWGKPIVAPKLSFITEYVNHLGNGFLFPLNDMRALKDILSSAVANRALSFVAYNVAHLGKHTGKDLMVKETVEGYALLLENLLKFPSEVETPKDVTEITPELKVGWKRHLFQDISGSAYLDPRNYRFLDKVERDLKYNQTESSDSVLDETFSYDVLEEEEYIEAADERREYEELKDRRDQRWVKWEEVHGIAKKADRRTDLTEREDWELDRTGQPLCIYEPYLGEGTWPFLHNTSLYRGVGLSTKGRRPWAYDIDARSHLPLLKSSYYRDVLDDYGAFFAIASRIDRIHKNAWIGFHSWRATESKKSFSETAENALLEAIEERKHGDALYFWVRMDTDRRGYQYQNFWSFCNMINAGNCRFAFSEAIKQMYGIKHAEEYLPPMQHLPGMRETWSVMNSWALPTRSFLEFVMFSRMFVDALDSQIYDEHHESGHCYLSLTKDKHCYSRVLELLINVWAYHSARRIVYMHPVSGRMHEYHDLNKRRGRMWLKWFSYSTLKSMDEDLAEESDTDNSRKRWLWPSTGEVFWQGVYDREKAQRKLEREKKRQRYKERAARMRKKERQQKPLK